MLFAIAEAGIHIFFVLLLSGKKKGSRRRLNIDNIIITISNTLSIYKQLNSWAVLFNIDCINPLRYYILFISELKVQSIVTSIFVFVYVYYDEKR